MANAAPAASPPNVAVIGGGPAGLMAAETIAAAGVQVDVYDAMPSVGRKFLMAGKGGMNITHSEPADRFVARYSAGRADLGPLLEAFGPGALREWVRGLGIATFVGSSGRVFPTGMKAAPLLRAWLHRLRAAGVRFHMRHRWTGWPGAAPGCIGFDTPQGPRAVEAGALVLALGGGSWARLGSDAAWVPLLAARGVAVAPLEPSNCGFDTGWSAHFRTRFAGEPVKPVAVAWLGADGNAHRRQGELMITATGVEGGLVYALGPDLRDGIAAAGTAVMHLDLAPGWEHARLAAEIDHPRGARSMAGHLQSRIGIKGVKTALLRELAPQAFADPEALAAAIKSLPLRVNAPRPLDEAISSAGGVRFSALDAGLMLRALPGVFCAGEMLDWDAPTGGYLLTACFATGKAAGEGVLQRLGRA